MAKVLALGAGACLAAAGAGCGDPSAPVRVVSRVAIVVMENKEYGQVIGSKSAPYLNRLARRYALATNYHAVGHPSLPNYLALTTGTDAGIASDCTGCTVRARSLVQQLDGAGITWRAYMEGLPRPCARAAFAGAYAKKHDPFLYFPYVRNSPRRCARVVPERDLPRDIRAGRLPQFLWITPNLCHDTHDCGVSAGDAYVARLVPLLLPALGPRGVLFITWDEGSSSRGCCGGAAGGHVPLIVAGPAVRRGVRLRAPLDHYSTLRAIEAAFDLSPLGRAACPCTREMNAIFATPPRFAAVR
jgi:phosphatidylinositol-3-phosphatase